jgi:uncharacterized repeat protein (TIGR03803 family)
MCQFSACRTGSNPEYTFQASGLSLVGSNPVGEVFMSCSRWLRPAVALGLTLLIAQSLEAVTYKVLHAFGKGKDGGGVFAGVAFDSKGNLFGATWGGGAFGYGTVFELTPGSGGKWTETILHSFCKNFPDCNDGALPSTTVVIDRAGDVYGASNTAAFELIPSGADDWSFQTIYTTSTNGGFVLDKAENLYGTWGPGKNKEGDVFKLRRESIEAADWSESVLYNFGPGECCATSSLIFDAAGNLYGTTKLGGSSGDGSAYRIFRDRNGAWRDQIMHSFSAGSDGQYPWDARLVLDSVGNAYGTTLQGGMGGTIFELSPNADGQWKETILYNFPDAQNNGGGPAAGLTFDKAGSLYGTTSAGGDPSCSCGVVFKLTPGSNGKWKYSVLHRFTGKDGWGPQASVILDDKGNLYGTTTEGGAYGYGVVFEITP